MTCWPSEDATSTEMAAQVQTLQNDIEGLQATVRESVISANRMDLESASAQTGVVVVQDAVPPSAPYAPDKQLYITLGRFCRALHRHRSDRALRVS